MVRSSSVEAASGDGSVERCRVNPHLGNWVEHAAVVRQCEVGGWLGWVDSCRLNRHYGNRAADVLWNDIKHCQTQWTGCAVLTGWFTVDGVVRSVVSHDTYWASRDGTVEKISTYTAISLRKLSTWFMIKAISGLLTPPAVSTSLRTSATSS